MVDTAVDEREEKKRLKNFTMKVYDSMKRNSPTHIIYGIIIIYFIFITVWSISMSRTFPRSCYGVSYAIKNQLLASKASY